MQINLEEVDVDGALQEAHAEAMGDTRLAFLKKAGIGAGALVGSGVLFSALGTGSAVAGEVGAPPAKPFGAGDVGILNYALTLEYLEHAFYTEAKKNNVAKGNAQLTTFLNTTQSDETKHVAFLKKALGSKAIASPKFNFGDAVKKADLFAATSYALENTGVHAYSGQARNITTPAYLLAALSIVTIEARHAGAIGLITGKGIDATGAFDTGYTYSQVIKIVDGTKFITKL